MWRPVPPLSVASCARTPDGPKEDRVLRNIASGGSCVQRGWLRVMLGAVAMGIGMAGAAPAEENRFGTGDATRASSSRAARDDAMRAIPWEQLSPDARQKVQWVLANTSVFRRLPIRIIQCDPDLYLFLVHNPDVVVNIWEVLGVSHLAMRRRGPNTYQVTDDIGTVGTLEFLYRSRDLQLGYVDGTYNGPMFGHRIRGRGLMLLRSHYVREADGRCLITSQLDAFMNIEPGGAEFLTKTFQPVVGKIADTNFQQSLGFLACVCRTAEVNQAGMTRLAAKLGRVPPEVRQRLAELSQLVAQRASQIALTEGDTPALDPDAPRTAERPEPSLK